MKSGNLLVLLKENRDYVSLTERNVVDYVLGNPDDCVGLSIHELAARSFTSASTVSRMCARLKVGGYKGFQRLLVYALATIRDSGHTRVEDLTPGDSTSETMLKITRRDMESISITEKLNDPATVDACVALMSGARTINLFGMGSSLLSARDLHYKLIRANVPCNVDDDWHVQLVCASNSGPDDLGIAFSYSGLTQEVIRCAQAVRERRGKLIVVTRAGHDSELVQLADQVLLVASTEPVFRSSATASRISQMALVDVLFTAFVNQNYDRCASAFGRNYIERR